MKQVFILVLLFAVPGAYAQQAKTVAPPPDRLMEFVGDSIKAPKAVFIGELHSMYEGLKFEFDVVKMMAARYGITDVVLEMGKSDAYMFNAYFSTGDTTILNFYGHTKDVTDKLQRWQQLYDACKCTFHGIDFERPGFVAAVLSVMHKHKDARNTALYAYLKSIDGQAREMPGGKEGRRQSIHMYAKARAEFRKEKESLKPLLGKDYAIVNAILENPATENAMKCRDGAMAENLSRLGTNSFICITGLGHTTLSRNTLLKRCLARDTAHSHIAVIDMVCRNCYSTSYYGTKLTPMIADYAGKNAKYMDTAFERHYKPRYYSLINQKEFKELPSGYNPVPTWYVLFRDQPEWE